MLPLGISAYKLCAEIFMPQTRVSQILKGKRRVTADTALRISKYFGTSSKFWLSLQDDFDLEKETRSKQIIFDKIKPFGATLDLNLVKLILIQLKINKSILALICTIR